MSELSEPIGLRTGEESLLNRLASVRVRVNWLVLAFVAVVVVGAAMRFWDLGSRALHHDESLHAAKALELFRGQGYNHEPWMHGPFQFFGTAFSYFLFGVTDYTARIFPATFGVALIALPFFLRSRLGNLGAILAAAAIAFSPTLLYFSRFARNDVYMAFFVLALVVLLWRYIDDQKPLYLYLTGLVLGLAFAAKESIFINVAVIVAFLDFWLAAHFGGQIADRNKAGDLGRAAIVVSLAPIAWALAALWPFTGGWRERVGLTRWHPAADMLIVLGTLTLPQFAAAITVPLGALGISDADLALSSLGGNSRENVLGFFTILGLIGATAVIGLRWNPLVWGIAALAFYVPYSLLYTTFFTNLDGFYSGHWGALDYWLSQQDVARGEQPWFYYMMLMPIYEFLPLLIAGPALLWYAIRGDAFRRFLVFWFFATLFGFSMAGEKMPWVSVNTTLPLVILGALALGELLTSSAPKKAGHWLVAYGRPLAAAALGLIAASLALFGPDSGGLEAIRWLLVVAALGGVALLVFPVDVEGTVERWLGRKRRGRQVLAAEPMTNARVLSVAASAVLGGLLAVTLFSAVRLSYEYGDVPREVLVYTQTSPFVPDVVESIDDAAAQSGLGEDLPIVIDGGIEPWIWYLRDYNQVSYQSIGQGYEPPAGAVVVALASNEGVMAEHADLYRDPVRFPLRWWFPEFDTYKTVPTADTIRGIDADTVPRFTDWFLADAVQASSWENWWDYWRYRVPPDTPGPVEDRLGRLDLIAYFPLEYDVEVPEGETPAVEQPPVQTEPPAPPPSLPETLELAVGAVIGSAGSGPGELRAPGALTIDGEGNLYVTEVENHRVQKFDPEGNLLAGVGSQGAGEGQFMEPWGVATDAEGNVYVADTFNHRIQKFDSDLEFTLAWGRPASSLDNPEEDAFWGPRDVAIDANGDVWVTDGGTNRILKFTSEGDFIAAYGGPGSGPGQLIEPTSVEITPDGAILVADSGNARVQQFDLDGNFVAEMPVPGWLYEDSVVKPYIALLPDGGFIVSDPTQNVLFRFDAAGTPVATLQAAGATPLALPRGLAYADGSVWVAEAGSHQLRQLTLADAPPAE